MELPDATKLYVMAPVEVQVGDKYESLWEEMRAAGYIRIRIDGNTYPIESPARNRPAAQTRGAGRHRPIPHHRPARCPVPASPAASKPR